MDLPDNILDDLDYIGDCITSCNKVGIKSCLVRIFKNFILYTKNVKIINKKW